MLPARKLDPVKIIFAAGNEEGESEGKILFCKIYQAIAIVIQPAQFQVMLEKTVSNSS